MSDSEEQMRRIDVMIRERDAAAAMMTERGARRVRAAAGKADPADVNFGMALGLERCGICKFYEPSSNPMTGACSVVDKYRVERNNWCEMFTIADPDTNGAPGGAVAKAAAEFFNMVTAAVPSLPAVVASNQALLGQHKLFRNRVEQRYSGSMPRVFARWGGDGC